MLASLNSFCRFAGLPIKVKFLKIQRQIFRDSAKELTKAGRATITLNCDSPVTRRKVTRPYK